ncbi:uncharacterized protein LOC117113610 [Anneissia japonica]|uniref:uncharacterized protein LOC117113610 n=1 Tax=Anneissia japonica TaxID=1529436 RepID=UPI0014258CD1|nr:uncharacterized protein LOC117113610 [Anneissia japonica]
MMDRLDFDCFFDSEWSFPEDSNLHRAVLLRNHALNHGIIYRLNRRKTEIARDIESMESFQQLSRKPSQVMTLEHLENGEIKTNNRVLIFDQNKGKTFVHTGDREVKLGNSILSAINNCKAKKLKKVSNKKCAQKSKTTPCKSVSQQCHIGPPNGFVNIPIRIQNLPPIKVNSLGPSNVVHSLAATKLTTLPTVTQLPPQTKQPRHKTTKNETTTMEKFNQSIHGKKLCGTKKRGPQKASNNKRTE